MRLHLRVEFTADEAMALRNNIRRALHENPNIQDAQWWRETARRDDSMPHPVG